MSGTSKVAVIGGPADGVECRRLGKFAYVNVGGAISPHDGPGRGLYTLTTADGVEVYLFAGDTHARCECGGYYRKAEGGSERQPCPLCGSRRPARVTR